jgi:disulfide bond formation protein DsbB
MREMMIPRLRFALLLCAMVSALALGVALGVEKYGDLPPCPLCLLERWPYRIAIVVALIGLVLPRPLGWLALAICILTFLVDGGIAFVHVGVEQHWWQSPLPECQAPDFTGMTAAERFAHMSAAPAKPCEDPTYLIDFIPLSMAGMNMLYALACTFGFARFALFHARSPR